MLSIQRAFHVVVGFMVFLHIHEASTQCLNETLALEEDEVLLELEYNFDSPLGEYCPNETTCIVDYRPFETLAFEARCTELGGSFRQYDWTRQCTRDMNGTQTVDDEIFYSHPLCYGESCSDGRQALEQLLQWTGEEDGWFGAIDGLLCSIEIHGESAAGGNLANNTSSAEPNEESSAGGNTSVTPNATSVTSSGTSVVCSRKSFVWSTESMLLVATGIIQAFFL